MVRLRKDTMHSDDLREQVRAQGLFSRRGFLTGAGAALVNLSLAEQFVTRTAAAQKIGDNPFKLGVASGDPLSEGIVLWTRLAVDPLNGGGMPNRPIAVQWSLASDANMRNVVQRGSTLATPELAHSVHVEVSGLQPSRDYWYQFKVGNEYSVVGHTRTAPPVGSSPGQLKFAFVSCQNYVNGYWPAHAALAEESLDFAVHLGDYIYESGGTGVRQHLPNRLINTINDYRTRHAQYRLDPALQAVHAAFPWIVTWDDHETINDYAGYLTPLPANQGDFEARRAIAYQVYYEHMPLRRAQLPRGSSLQLYRRLDFANLVRLHVLDTRQYRSALAPASCAAASRVKGYCPSALDPSRTIEGQAQRDWLIEGIRSSPAAWNVLANQVPFAPNNTSSNPAAPTFGGEKWDGYPLDRKVVLDFLAQQSRKNTVVITGDVHVNYVRNIPPDYERLDAAPVATEFVGTSISSGGDRTLVTEFGETPANPHQRFYNNNHGYVRCTLTPQLYTAEYRVVPTVIEQTAPVSTAANFVVEQGRPGAQTA